MTTTGADGAETGTADARHFILGTAGHIDHGKTSLIRALTGTDTDRLPEERRRGMTIELGFAELVIGDTQFGVVDVPGHERFVRTMVAGATAIDVALIVVAADDSVMPQTLEHIDILHLLGVQRAVVAITKIDLMDAEMVELVMDDIGDLLSGSPLEGAPMFPVSSTTGVGMDELKRGLVAATRDIHTSSAAGPFRMSVDRVFTVPGRGMVVTGSTARGAVATGDTLEVWPGGHACRVRDLQAHGEGRNAVTRGMRAAINIAGIDRDHVARGAELTTPGYLEPSPMIDVRLRCLPSLNRPLKSTTIVRLGMGTREVPVRVVFFDRPSLEPGESGYAQLRSGEPLTTTYGQRFIIRDETASRTVGGGVVLRPMGRRKRRERATNQQMLEALETGDEASRVEQVLRLARFSSLTDLQLAARSGVEPDGLPTVLEELKRSKRWRSVADTNTHAVPAAVDDLFDQLAHWLERYHQTHPDTPGRSVDTVLGWLERLASRSLARPLLDQFVAAKALKRLGRFVCLPAFAPSLSSADEKLLAELVDEVRAGGFQPPTLDELATAKGADRKRMRKLATLAVALGDLVPVDTKLYLAVDAEQTLRATVTDLVMQSGGATVAQVREALDSTRKFVIPFLEHLDRVGFTKRVGDQRILVADPAVKKKP